jgi:predicted phosphodiesterase
MKPEQVDEIGDLIVTLFNKVPVRNQGKQWRFNDFALQCWLSDNFGSTAKTKQLPEWFKNLDSNHLTEFMSSCMSGDGGQNTETSWTYKSTSDRLIDDMQEVALKLGYRTSVGEREGNFNTGYYGSAVPLYLNSRRDVGNVTHSLVDYDGLVYCPTVENGLIYVRQEGKVCVTGNSRQNGKIVTDDADNDDVAVFEQIADIFSNVKEYSHMKFWIPAGGEQTSCYEISNTPIGLTHGHLTRGGKHPMNALWEWWKSQTFGVHAVSSAKLMVTGHFHHLEIKQESGRTLFICPAMQQDSKHFRERWGVSSDPGTLSFVVNNGTWDEMKVL